MKGGVRVTEFRRQLRITVFSDYICPFCYVGDARLNRLRERYDLKVNWCFLEIHPETSVEGEPVSALGYSEDTWRRMMVTLQRLAQEEDIPFQNHDFTTNSRSALQLAEAAKAIDRDLFYRLHASLFEAFFVHEENIGDRLVLRRLAQEAGMSRHEVEWAWGDQTATARLRQYNMAARELAVRATPTFFVGARRLDGVVPVDRLFEAAQDAMGRAQS